MKRLRKTFTYLLTYRVLQMQCDYLSTDVMERWVIGKYLMFLFAQT